MKFVPKLTFLRAKRSIFVTMNFTRLLLSGILLFQISAFAQAQNKTISADSLNFGTHTKWEKDSAAVWLYNQKNFSIQVEDVNVYGWDFSLMGDTSFAIGAMDSAQVWLSFIPRHNMEYEGQAVIVIKDQGAWNIDLYATGTYPGTYYSTTFNLHEEALKSALKTQLAKNYTSLGYNTARDWIFMSIDNEKTNGGGASVNTLYTAYIGRKVEGYVSRTDAQNKGNVNTEHTYPQSKFGSAEPMVSDIFHLFVVDAGVNSRRSNNPFSMVASPSWTDGGAKYGNGFFEPRDAQKGQTARAMLYYLARYKNDGNFMNDLVSDAQGNIVTQEVLMRQWAVQFPPTEKDSLRNEAIFKLQKNRNPFIDHPEFLERIHFLGQNSIAPIQRSFEINVPDQTHLRFSGTNGDTSFYQLCITNTGNTVLPIALSMKGGSAVNFSSSLFNVPVNKSEQITISVVRNAASAEKDSLIIKSSAIAGYQKALPVDITFFNVGLGQDNSGLLLYPNPSTGSFFIANKNGEDIALEVFNPQGIQVMSAVLNQPLNEISLPNSVAGVYFVRMTQGRRVIQRHLVIR